METQGTRASLIFGGEKRRALTDLEEKSALEIIQSLMNCLGKFQQYPSLNPIVFEAMQDLDRNLKKWFRTFPDFQANQIQNALQVNKSFLSPVAQQKDFLQAFMFYLTERNILTFEVQPGINIEEIQQFLQYFSKPAKDIVGRSNFSRAMKRMGVRHIHLSNRLILDDVIIKTEMSDELTGRLSKLNAGELLEKANIISQLDLETLYKVGDLATMVTNLRYTKNKDMSHKIVDRINKTFDNEDAGSRLTGAKTLGQISDKAVDYTMYDFHSELGKLMSDRLTTEKDPNVFSSLAKNLEKSAQVHIAMGEYDLAMNIINSISPQDLAENSRPPQLQKLADASMENIASEATVHRLVTNLQTNDEKVRSNARKLLSYMGSNSVSELIDLIYSTEEKQAFETAIRVLIEIGQSALPELYSELKEEMNYRFRAAFLRVIGHIGDVHSVKRVVLFLLHENEIVAAEAFRAALRIGGPAAERQVISKLSEVEFSKNFFKDRVVDFGYFRNEELVEPLLELLQGKGPFLKYNHPEVEFQTVRALSRIGTPEAIAGLCELLNKREGFLGLRKGNERLKVAICKMLGSSSSTDAYRALKRAKKNRSKAVRIAAAEAKGYWEENNVEPDEPPTTVTPPQPLPSDKTIAPTVLAPKNVSVQIPEETTAKDETEEVVEDPFFNVSPDEETREILPPETEDAIIEERPDELPELGEPEETSEFGDFEDINSDIEEPEQEETEFTFEDFEPASEKKHSELEFEDIKPEPGQSIQSAIESLELQDSRGNSPASSQVRIIPCIGTYVADNVLISISEIDEGEKMTSDQQGAVFTLEPGNYELIVRDKGMKISKNIVVGKNETELRVDLQDIFNF